MKSETLESVREWRQLFPLLFFGPKPSTPEARIARLSMLQNFKRATEQLALACEENGIDNTAMAQAIFVEVDVVNDTYSGLPDELGDQCCLAVKKLELRIASGVAEPAGNTTTGISRKGEAGDDNFGGKEEPRATVNERMKAGMVADLEKVQGWTAQQWADCLNCGKSTVIETATWKSLAALRQQAKAVKRNDRHRR